MRTCALFSFSTAIHCYIGSFWLIFLFNSHSLLYRIIVAYFPLEQPLIVIWDHCGLFSFRTATHCYMGSLWLILLFNSHSLLYAKLWLILLFNSHSLLYRIIVAYFRFQHPFLFELVPYFLFNSHSLLYANLWLIPLFNSHSLLYANFGLFFFSTAILSLWLILLFSLLYRIIVPYSPFQQPFIVICDHCGLFSFSTATHCYMGSLWLILL